MIILMHVFNLQMIIIQPTFSFYKTHSFKMIITHPTFNFYKLKDELKQKMFLLPLDYDHSNLCVTCKWRGLILNILLLPPLLIHMILIHPPFQFLYIIKESDLKDKLKHKTSLGKKLTFCFTFLKSSSRRPFNLWMTYRR